MAKQVVAPVYSIGQVVSYKGFQGTSYGIILAVRAALSWNEKGECMSQIEYNIPGAQAWVTENSIVSVLVPAAK